MSPRRDSRGGWAMIARDGDGIDATQNATPKDLIGTAYYAYSMGIASHILFALCPEFTG